MFYANLQEVYILYIFLVFLMFGFRTLVIRIYTIVAKELIDKDSLLNTPPTFSIYVLKLVTDWMLNAGGVEYFEKQSQDHSTKVYSMLSKYSDHVSLPVEEYARSKMNVVFNFKNEQIEKRIG